MSQNVTFPAIITKLETLADNTIQIKLATQELPPDEVAVLFGLKGGICYALLSVKDIGQKELEGMPKDFPEVSKQTPSQRLRYALYRKWEEQETNMAFENYYQIEMTKIIEGVNS